MSPITLSPRPATEDDIDSVVRLEKSVAKQPWSATQFRDELVAAKSTFLVLTDDETDEVVAGFIVYRELLGETHILNVAVDPKFRRRGWGRRLVMIAINDAYRRTDERIFLEVRVSNAGAQALYGAMGFREAGRRKAFYSDGEEALFMELNVAGASTAPLGGSGVYH